MMKTRDGLKSSSISKNSNNTDGHGSFGVTREPTKLRRIISFGQAASTLPLSQLPRIDPQDLSDGSLAASNLCQEVWTEYNELDREKTRNVADKKAYTARTLLDLLRMVAPKMMKRAEVHFSHGIANDLDDPKSNHFKYWSNPLKTRLPNAPDMEIYCLYGVGILTERSYVYKISFADKCKSIPFRIAGTANGDTDTCLRGGVYFVDGDESMPVESAGFICARECQPFRDDYISQSVQAQGPSKLTRGTMARKWIACGHHGKRRSDRGHPVSSRGGYRGRNRRRCDLL